MKTLKIKCSGCGNESWYEPQEEIPEKATYLVTSFCPECENGQDFEESWYEDVEGNLVHPIESN